MRTVDTRCAAVLCSWSPGWDVWFGNVRGNVFSRNHSVLAVDDAVFWSFSWDDMAAKDLPAMLHHELAVRARARRGKDCSMELHSPRRGGASPVPVTQPRSHMHTYAQVTGATSLSYVGHSQGTTLAMALLASPAHADLAARINVSPRHARAGGRQHSSMQRRRRTG